MTLSKRVAWLLCVAALVAWPALAAAQEGGHGAEAHADAHGAAGGHGHGADGHGGAMATDPLAFDPDLAIWTMIIFGLLLAVLWKFAWGPIAEGLDKREKRIADEIAAAEQQNLDAKALLAEYERKLAAAQDEIRALLDDARRDAEQTQQEMLAKAAADGEAIKQRARREIETATDQALKSLADHSARLAVELAGKIVGAELTPDRHARLIEDAMAKFPQAPPSAN